MGNDCLVTKLKGKVDNESLLKLGSIKVSVHVDTDFPDARPYIFINGDGVSSVPTVRIIGDYTFADTGTKVHELAYGSGMMYNADDIVFPNGTYELEISHKYKITNLRLSANNGGMIIANHRNDAIVFNVEDLAYSPELRGFMYVYQDVYGDMHTLAEKGFVSKVNGIRLTGCSKIKGTLKDLCIISRDVFNGGRTDSNNVSIELKEGGNIGKTGITGSIHEAIDYVKDIAVANAVLRLDIGGNTTLDRSGIELPPTTDSYTFTFDGNGSYTVVGN
jgi:hypothetical protein